MGQHDFVLTILFRPSQALVHPLVDKFRRVQGHVNYASHFCPADANGWPLAYTYEHYISAVQLIA